MQCGLMLKRALNPTPQASRKKSKDNAGKGKKGKKGKKGGGDSGGNEDGEVDSLMDDSVMTRYWRSALDRCNVVVEVVDTANRMNIECNPV